MINNIDQDKYGDCWITIENFTSNNIISFGTDIFKVVSEAKEKGFEYPVVFFVHKKGTTCIF